MVSHVFGGTRVAVSVAMFVAALALGAGCSGASDTTGVKQAVDTSTTAPAPAPATPDGSWIGTTSEGRAVSFVIVGTSITNLTIGFNLTGDCGLGGFTAIVNGGVGHLSGQQIVIGDSTSFVYLSGQIVGNSTASGSALANYEGAFSNGPTCHSTGSSTWTASKH